MGETARKAFVTTLVAVGVVVLALALWKLRLVVALLFAGFIIAAAMRPGIEALHRRGIPRGGRARRSTTPSSQACSRSRSGSRCRAR